MPERTDHNEAMRLADELAGDQLYGLQRRCRDEAAALLRQQAERIAELEAERDQHKATATALIALLADIRKACGDDGKRMQPELVEFIGAMSTERDQLRAEVERLRVDAEQWQAHKEVLKASHLDESLTIRMTMRHKGLNVEREGVLTMLAAERAIAGGDEIAAHMAGRYFNEMKSAIDAARTTHKETE